MGAEKGTEKGKRTVWEVLVMDGVEWGVRERGRELTAGWYDMVDR